MSLPTHSAARGSIARTRRKKMVARMRGGLVSQISFKRGEIFRKEASRSRQVAGAGRLCSGMAIGNFQFTLCGKRAGMQKAHVRRGLMDAPHHQSDVGRIISDGFATI